VGTGGFDDELKLRGLLFAVSELVLELVHGLAGVRAGDVKGSVGQAHLDERDEARDEKRDKPEWDDDPSASGG
jgi:hypothetical protein